MLKDALGDCFEYSFEPQIQYPSIALARRKWNTYTRKRTNKSSSLENSMKLIDSFLPNSVS